MPTTHSASAAHKLAAAAGVVLAFAWPWLVGGPAHSLTSVHGDVRSICAEWLIALILVAIAFGFERRLPKFFGLRMFGWRDLLVMAGVLVAAFFFSGIASRFVRAPSFNLQFSGVPLSLRAGLVLTAGICEEFIYRGFAIEELGALAGSRWLAALISLIFFTLPHAKLYGFSSALVLPAIMGAALTLLYLWRHNLPVCMLMHAIVDGIFLILVPALH
ncbi:MAG: CPBP family intramembrane glutamic endopeptidase [Candidatus Acidiferrales bacterium]